MKKTGGYTVLGAIAFLASAGIVSWGQPDVPRLQYYWGPGVGDRPDHFVVERMLVTASGDTAVYALPDAPDTTTIVDYLWGVDSYIRVAGVDTLGRQGPWSIWSAVWSDDGLPAAPGAISQTLIMDGGQ